MFDLYEVISTGEGVEIDLNPPGRVSFDVRLGQVKTRDEFTRTLRPVDMFLFDKWGDWVQDESQLDCLMRHLDDDIYD